MTMFTVFAVIFFSNCQTKDTMSIENSNIDTFLMSRVEEVFRNDVEFVEGFYKTYEDFLNQRITDTMEFSFENNPLVGENRLSIVERDPTSGKIKKIRKFNSENSGYWGARINNFFIGYRDYRFYESKVLEILLAGDIWMYSTGGLHVVMTKSVPMVPQYGKRLIILENSSGVNSELQLAKEYHKDGQKDMAYIQKGLNGDLVRYRAVLQKPLLDLIDDKKNIYDSFKGAKVSIAHGFIIEAYKHISLYNQK